MTMKTQTNTRFFSLLIAVIVAILTSNVAVFAEDTADPSTYNPKVILSSISTVEISEAQTKEIIIEVKNVGTAAAYNFFMQAIPEATYPFKLSTESLGGSDILQAGVTKRIKLTITTDKGAAEKTYPLKLKYSYINEFKSTFSNEDTLNIRIGGTYASVITLENFELKPTSITAGGSGVFSFDYANNSSANLSYLKIALEGLDTAAITVLDGLSTQIFTNMRAGNVEKLSFNLKASANCKNGSYPIKIVVTTKNASGENVTEERVYYVSVGVWKWRRCSFRRY